MEGDDDTSQHHEDISLSLELGPSAWPSSTELLTLPGSTQVTLGVQSQLMRTLIQDTISNLRAALLFGDAFPKPAVAAALIKDALIVTAEVYKPDSDSIYRRLMVDSIYLTKMTALVSFPVTVMTWLTIFTATCSDPTHAT
jgi:hypothetical protein